MPVARHKTDTSARVGPYPHDHAKPTVALESSTDEHDKENASPAKQAPVSKTAGARSASEPSETWTSYRDIPLPEIKGEVPVYENATQIRRKLNKLLESKAKIPGTNKTWNKTSLSAELKAIAQVHHPVEFYNHTFSNSGPAVPAITRFLKKTRSMGGADSETYYFANMLLEKLMIYNKEKKTAARIKAEKEFPNGRQRVDPHHVTYICHVSGPGFSYSQLANGGR